MRVGLSFCSFFCSVRKKRILLSRYNFDLTITLVFLIVGRLLRRGRVTVFQFQKKRRAVIVKWGGAEGGVEKLEKKENVLYPWYIFIDQQKLHFHKSSNNALEQCFCTWKKDHFQKWSKLPPSRFYCQTRKPGKST